MNIICTWCTYIHDCYMCTTFRLSDDQAKLAIATGILLLLLLPIPHKQLLINKHYLTLPSSIPYPHRSLMVRRTNISAELLVEPVSPASIAKKDSMGRRFKVDNPIVTDPNKRFLRIRSLSNTFTFIRS